MALGNLQLAQSDLTRLSKDYAGTYSGTEGAMVLAQLSFDQGKFADGVQLLQGTLSKAPAAMVPEIDDLIAGGDISLNKALDAARSYEAAAAATTLPGERAHERSKAARSYETGGDTARARAIWTDLSQDFKNPGIAAEARVRLGQAEAKAAGRG
jgi:predicted negative regulator of RcsB-dependent stress response